MAYFSYYYLMETGVAPESVAILYHYYNGEDDDLLENTFENLLNRRLSPTRILIICGFGFEKSINKTMKQLPETVRERLNIVTHVKILPYGINGEAILGKDINFGVGDDWHVTDEELEKIAFCGMKRLIEKTGVKMRAPFGYVFRKPSGDKISVFFRAGNMFKEPEGLAVIIHLLMRNISHEIDKIYIDSFTILSAVLALQRYRQSIFKKLKLGGGYSDISYKEPSIKNFHSYDIDSDMLFPIDTNYRILISASTSGKLSEKLVSENLARKEQILHLLYFSSEDDTPEGIIYKGIIEEQFEPDDSLKKVIDIPSEAFMVSPGSPHVVNISRHHVCEKAGLRYKDSFYNKGLALNLSGSGYSSHSFVNLKEDGKNFPRLYKDWIKDLVNYDIPTNTSCIVTTENTKDCLLTEKIYNKLTDHINKEICTYTLQDIQAQNFKECEKLKGTVLIVASQGGRGEELLAASRSLRNYKFEHRHYIIGHFFPESYDEYDFLCNNLCTSMKQKRYGLSSYQVSPIGNNNLHNSWHMEKEILSGKEINSRNKFFSKLAKDRKKILHEFELDGDKLFLPTVGGQVLKIRKDSIIFKKNYDPDDISQVTVYILIATMLQRARENCDAKRKKMDDEYCFQNNPFLSSVLDPYMFTRYNDGIIQAAFLRACTPDELNYASCNNLSTQMKNILISSITHCAFPTGEAVLEMLFALCTERMSLCLEDKEEIFSIVKKNQRLRPFFQLLTQQPVL